MRDKIVLSSDRRIMLTVLSMSLGWVFIYLDRVLIFPLLPVIGEEFSIMGEDDLEIVDESRQNIESKINHLSNH